MRVDMVACASPVAMRMRRSLNHDRDKGGLAVFNPALSNHRR